MRTVSRRDDSEALATSTAIRCASLRTSYTLCLQDLRQYSCVRPRADVCGGTGRPYHSHARSLMPISSRPGAAVSPAKTPALAAPSRRQRPGPQGDDGEDGPGPWSADRLLSGAPATAANSRDHKGPPHESAGSSQPPSTPAGPEGGPPSARRASRPTQPAGAYGRGPGSTGPESTISAGREDPSGAGNHRGK